MFQLCAPAFIYLLISLLDIFFNTYMGLFNNLLSKSIVVISVTLFLNILCEKGFSEISWLIILISFVLIVIVLLNNMGCNIYYIPANDVIKNTPIIPTNNKTPIAPIQKQTPIATIQKQTPIVPIQKQTPIVPIQKQTPIAPIQKQTPIAPISNISPTKHSYAHIPFGSSDPAYQS